MSLFLPERGKGHDCQNEPTEDQFCHPQQWPLDWPSLLQPPGWQPDLQGDEEDGEEHLKSDRRYFQSVRALCFVEPTARCDPPANISAWLSFGDEANTLLIPVILCPAVLISIGDGPSWHTLPLTPHLSCEKLTGAHSGRRQQSSM